MCRIRIAQIIATFPPYLAGIGNVCYHKSIELAKLGHDFTISIIECFLLRLA